MKIVTAYNELPDSLQCVQDNNLSLCSAMGLSYEVRPLDMGEYTCPRAASDDQRVRMLSTEPYTMWLDWDVVLEPNFVWPDSAAVCTTFDCLQYNHDDTDRWQQLLKYYEAFVVNRPRHLHRAGDMWKCMWRSGLFAGLRTIRSGYKHFSYHKSGGMDIKILTESPVSLSITKKTLI